ncbi:hypothetical protein DNTS_012368, partial [Danionella cerebrum]
RCVPSWVSRDPMELDFFTNEQLLRYFRRKKTQISTIEQPRMLLSHLRDHGLLRDDLYKAGNTLSRHYSPQQGHQIQLKPPRANIQKVNAMRSQKQKGLYEVLDCLEKERSEHMHFFWRCVFEDYILQMYPLFRVFKHCLQDPGLWFL